MSAWWYVDEHAVPSALTGAALRLINREIRRRGITADEIADWQATTAFPWLRDADEIAAVRDCLTDRLPVSHGDTWAEPQILLRYPDEDDVTPGEPHTDALPPWAVAGQEYRLVVGVALTDDTPTSGPLEVCPPDGEPTRLPLRAGDAVVFDPELPHRGTPNESGVVRVALYYRLLSGAT